MSYDNESAPTPDSDFGDSGTFIYRGKGSWSPYLGSGTRSRARNRLSVNRVQMIIARCISYTFGFLAGLTGRWWLLWFGLAMYLAFGIAFRYLGRIYKIPAEKI